MIWQLTKSNHKWAIHPLVRAWLRAGRMTRFLVIVAISAFLSVIGMLLNFGDSEFLDGLSVLLGWIAWIFWIVDAYMDKRTTQHDLRKLLSSPNVALATRGEYIGGHPRLPHGRFVYLTLGGVLENPQLNILLPQGGDKEPMAFSVPVLDLQKATQSLERTGTEASVGVTLASVTFRSKFLGEQALLNIEYIAQAGRKQRVELSHFLDGAAEVQNWRNFVVCIQAQADTGQPPYGPWKSLPAGQATAQVP